MATYYLPSSTTWYSTSNNYIKYRFKIDETITNGVRDVSVTWQMYKNSNSSAVTAGNGTITMVIDGKTYTKTVKNSTITYNLNGATSTASTTNSLIENPEDGIYIKPDGTTRDYFTVKPSVAATTTSLSVSGSIAISVANLSSSSQGSSVALTVPAYTVSYNANGGSGAPGAQTKTYGVNLTLSSTVPTRTGHTFQGWATSAGGGVAYGAGATYTANASATLYAVWTANTYTIYYNANNGSGAPSATSYTYASSGTVNLSTTVPTRTGYSFLGWSQSSTATSASYSAGQAWNRSNASNYTLYAVWKINTYTVSYNANGGSGAPSAQTKTYNTTLTLSGTKPTRTGYTFKNWNTAANGTGTSYNAGGSYTANSGVTLYAQWTAITYTVSYNANGGNNAPSAQTKTYGVTLSLSTTIPTREGYQFLGWGTSADATTATYGAGGNYTANSSVTLYAVWVQVQTATVQQIMARYQLPDGDFTEYSQVYAASLEEGDTCSWSFDETTEYEAVSVSYTVGKEAMTKYVDVLRRKYTINYDANGGLCAPKAQKFYYGSNLHLTMRRPTRSGYDFLGWAYSPTATTVDYKKGDSFDSTNVSTPTLYAIWAKAYSENIYFYDDGRCEACEFIEDDYLALGGGLVTTGLKEMYVSGVDVEEVSSLVDEALNLVGGDE